MRNENRGHFNKKRIHFSIRLAFNCRSKKNVEEISREEKKNKCVSREWSIKNQFLCFLQLSIFTRQMKNLSRFCSKLNLRFIWKTPLWVVSKEGEKGIMLQHRKVGCRLKIYFCDLQMGWTSVLVVSYSFSPFRFSLMTPGHFYTESVRQ